MATRGGWSILLAAMYLTGCSSVQVLPNWVVQLYKGDRLPADESVVVTSALNDGLQTFKRNQFPVELHAVNERRFEAPGGLGGGVYEVHMRPGEYELVIRADIPRNKKLASDSVYTTKVTLDAKPGRVYALLGELYVDSRTGMNRWRPVVLDKGRVAAHLGEDAPAAVASNSQQASLFTND